VHTLKLNISVQMNVREMAGTQRQTHQTECGKFSPQTEELQTELQQDLSLPHGTVVRIIWELGFHKVFALWVLLP